MDDIYGLTPDEQMKTLCDINGPITMLVALEQVFRDMVEHSRLPRQDDMHAIQAFRVNMKIADSLAQLIKSVAGS